jgi:L-fucose isomerase-like protein
MKGIAIYTLTSELHDEGVVGAATEEFLDSLELDYDFRGSDFSDFGTHALDLIYVRTGGTEGIFSRLLSDILERTYDQHPQRAISRHELKPLYLLTSGKSNSLAASMEILSYLKQRNMKGEIIHGSAEYIKERIAMLQKVSKAKKELNHSKLGVIGEPSDWLISSSADYLTVRERSGIELIDIPMSELLREIEATADFDLKMKTSSKKMKENLPGAGKIMMALKTLVNRHGLEGLTLRCFDLLTAVKNTGCLALAHLNAEGYVAGCEGDIPAMLSMRIIRALTGISGFQANPSSINPETGEMVLAHCTIPLNMVERYELDTHFESGIGVAIRGYMKEGPVTIFKVSGDLQRYFVAEGELIANEAKPDLCRTQQVIRLNDKSQANYFLTNPIGNHHIVVLGKYKKLIDDFFK